MNSRDKRKEWKREGRCSCCGRFHAAPERSKCIRCLTRDRVTGERRRRERSVAKREAVVSTVEAPIETVEHLLGRVVRLHLDPSPKNVRRDFDIVEGVVFRLSPSTVAIRSPDGRCPFFLHPGRRIEVLETEAETG
jgi:hypothetical protein